MNKRFTTEMDKTSFEIISMNQESNDRDFWLTRPVEERLNAIEFLRRQFYDYDPVTSRLQRVLEIAE